MNLTIIGCGYVGTAVARYWQQKPGQLVTVTTTRKERVAELEEVATQVVVMKGNDTADVESLVQNQDVIFVSVAPISNRQVDADIYEKTYIPTAKNLVTALRDASSLKQLIYISSCSVYGNTNGEWVNENSPVAPADQHGEVMVQAERILLQASSEKLKVCILRSGGIYGPERELAKRFGKLAGKTLPGTGDSFINWVHLDDIVSAVDFVRENQCQGIYNLVDDTKLTLRELGDRVCDRHSLSKISWDATQPSLRDTNIRVENKKIKVVGYQFIHPDLLI